ncbi:MAG: hypothetical protein V3G42_09320 [Oscillospiraceae bacterium]
MKKMISLMLYGIVAATAFMFGSMTTGADETAESVTYTVQDIRNLQDFLLVRPTKENLVGKSYRAETFTFYRYIATFQATFLLKGEFMLLCKVTVFP